MLEWKYLEVCALSDLVLNILKAKSNFTLFINLPFQHICE